MVTDLIEDIRQNPLLLVALIVGVVATLSIFSYVNTIAMNEAADCLAQHSIEICSVR